MTPDQAFNKWASERGVSQEIDVANWDAYQEALRTNDDANQAPEQPQQASEEPILGVAPSSAYEAHLDEQPHE